MNSSREELESALTDANCEINGTKVRCAFHGDRHASGSIYQSEDGKWRYKCHGCPVAGDAADIKAQATGRPLKEFLSGDRANGHNGHGSTNGKTRQKEERRLPAMRYKTPEDLARLVYPEMTVEAVYVYEKADKTPDFAVIRFAGKDFRQCLWTPIGWCTSGPQAPYTLFRLPQLLANDGPVVFCEGEKDVLALAEVGILATTTPMGADASNVPPEKDGKPGKADLSPLAGRDVIAYGDADDAGKRHMARVSRLLGALSPPAKVRTVADEKRRGTKDPAEFLERYDPKEFFDVIDSAKVAAREIRLKLKRKEDRLESAKNPREMVIDGLLPLGGVGAAIGMPGGGKSLWTTHLAECVAMGRPIGPRETKRGRVLMVTPDSPTSTDRRTCVLSDPAQDRIVTVGEMLPLPGGADELREAIQFLNEEDPSDPVTLVILDTWDAVREHTDGNSDGLLEEIMRALRPMAEQLRTSFLIVHHATRVDANRARGSLVFDARMDAIVIIETKDDNDGKIISVKVTKSRDGDAGFLGAWAIEQREGPAGDLLPVLVPAQIVKKKIDLTKERDNRVLAAIQDLGGIGQTVKKAAIMAHCDIKNGTLYRALESLHDAGLVDKETLKLTEKGKAALDPFGGE